MQLRKDPLDTFRAHFGRADRARRTRCGGALGATKENTRRYLTEEQRRDPPQIVRLATGALPKWALNRKVRDGSRRGTLLNGESHSLPSTKIAGEALAESHAASAEVR
jgi:hypothetical protein